MAAKLSTVICQVTLSMRLCPMPEPYADPRVREFVQFVAGPLCAMHLGDLGADVIKVERPYVGDSTRAIAPPLWGGESCYFLGVNRNRRSVALALKHADGQRIARELALRADVMIEALYPGAADGLGLGYEALEAASPRLVYCKISGFGRTGPASPRPAMDLMMQAWGGLMSVTGEAGQVLEETLRRRPVAKWQGLLDGASIPNAPMNTIDRVLADPQVGAREMLVRVPHPRVPDLQVPRIPFQLSRTAPSIRRPPPMLGEHSEGVLAELGYGAEDRKRLKEEGVYHDARRGGGKTHGH